MNSLPRAEVLNTGTELLAGSVLNTLLPYLAEQLFPLGLRIQRQTTVPDGATIKDAILEAASRCEFIFITGGLGPTSDDLTRDLVADLTNRTLQYNETIFRKIKARFEQRGLRLTDRIARQAYVPEGATILPNDFGTAPGLYVPARGAIPHLFLFPGPPRELRPMFETHALTILRDLVGKHDLDGRIFRTSGLGESYIEEMVGDALEGIPGLETGYCARLGEVDVRVIGPGATVAAADRIIRSKLAPYITTTENKELEEIVVKLLRDKGATLAIAESCTGGLLASRITNVPGASQALLEGNVTYSNEAKTRTLAVPAEMITRFGAVSEEVAAAMAEGARNRAGSTFALATTGIAGPDGGTPEKPVGTVFIGLAAEGTTTEVQELFFPMDRLSFKRITSQYALDMLRRRCS